MGNAFSAVDCCGAREPSKGSGILAQREKVNESETLFEKAGSAFTAACSAEEPAPPDTDIKKARKEESTGLRAVVLQPGQTLESSGQGPSESQADQKAGKQGGVGLFFVKDQSNPTRWVVRSVIKNGPAFNTNQIKESDILVSVDGVAVGQNETLAQLSKMLMGPVGSVIVLRFTREGQEFEVPLTRSDTFTGADGGDKRRVWQATRTHWTTDQKEEANVSL